MAHRVGNDTIALDRPVHVAASAAVGSAQELQGPFGKCFDYICKDPYFGQKTWEKAESHMQEIAVKTALGKARIKDTQVQGVFAGDLLNQCVGSSYAMRKIGAPFVGMYGACSTMAESLAAASLVIDGGGMDNAVACTSSHFCAAERQYRLPLTYGGQRTPTAQLTATAAGALVLTKNTGAVAVHAVTVGTIEDLGITDANNMGAAMAPAAAKTISRYFADTGAVPENFDAIVTGDLGIIGKSMLYTLLERAHLNIKQQHQDCGVMLYDIQQQDAHAGASGCGCGASLLAGHFLPLLTSGKYRRILFVATGALLSPTVIQQGESIASIAHLVELRSCQEDV